MCKPAVTHLPVEKSNGPCSFSIRSHGTACAAFWLGESWRIRIANVLRRWADKVEDVQSLVIIGSGPSQIRFSDVCEASVIGFNGATKYLNDLWRDRVFGSQGDKVKPIIPEKQINH